MLTPVWTLKRLHHHKKNHIHCTVIAVWPHSLECIFIWQWHCLTNVTGSIIFALAYEQTPLGAVLVWGAVKLWVNHIFLLLHGHKCKQPPRYILMIIKIKDMNGTNKHTTKDIADRVSIMYFSLQTRLHLLHFGKDYKRSIVKAILAILISYGSQECRTKCKVQTVQMFSVNSMLCIFKGRTISHLQGVLLYTGS